MGCLKDDGCSGDPATRVLSARDQEKCVGGEKFQMNIGDVYY